jgi:hypothetical protein
LIALFVLNLGYAFEGTGQPLGAYSFRSAALGGTQTASGETALGNRFSKSWLGAAPIPLPKNFLIGMDAQKYDFERGLRSYFLGEIKTNGEGWWWFYLYAIAVKVPLGTLALALLAIPMSLKGKAAGQLMLVLPGLCFLMLVSSQVGLHFFRYLLPAFPFAFIWISQVTADWSNTPRLAAAALIALSASISSSLICFPHSLSYFNELVGGPKNGYRIMADANVDWGQDLIYLKEWIEQNPSARGMKLRYYGPVDPVIAGLDVISPTSRSLKHAQFTTEVSNEPGRTPQWEAVSVTHLAYQHALNKKVRRSSETDQVGWLEYLYEVEPDVRIGYSIHVYRIAH